MEDSSQVTIGFSAMTTVRKINVKALLVHGLRNRN